MSVSYFNFVENGFDLVMFALNHRINQIYNPVGHSLIIKNYLNFSLKVPIRFYIKKGAF